MTKQIFLFLIVTGSILSQNVIAQEFSIATAASDTAYAGAIAYDGTNYLMALSSDSLNQKISAQLFSGSGSLVGDKIAIGKGGNPKVAFDGTNYLVVWHADYYPIFGSDAEETTGNIFGQFVNTSGTLVGSSFTIATGVSSKFFSGGALAFNDTTYFLAYATGNDDKDIAYTLYGQRINKSGSLVGSAVLISELSPRDVRMAYDGNNYLVIWVQDEDNDENGAGLSDVYGQYVSKSGELVGTNFVIDDGDYVSDRGISVAFDGSRYLVLFCEGEPCLARFVTTSGSVSDRITICDSATPLMPMVAFDGTNYLLTWVLFASSTVQIKGRYYNTSGVAIDTAFTIFETLNGKYPLSGGVCLYTKDGYFVGATRGTYTNEVFTDGDVYGKFLQASTTGVNEIKNVGNSIKLYPNPATDAFQVTGIEGTATIIVSDLNGRLLFTKEVTTGETVSVSTLPNGMYLATIKSKDITETEKLVIQH